MIETESNEIPTIWNRKLVYGLAIGAVAGLGLFLAGGFAATFIAAAGWKFAGTTVLHVGFMIPVAFTGIGALIGGLIGGNSGKHDMESSLLERARFESKAPQKKQSVEIDSPCQENTLEFYHRERLAQ